MFSSPLLSINLNKAEPINPDLPICAGYLDSALLIFEKHNHPFMLVSTFAMIWSGSNHSPEREIDVLVRSSQFKSLVDDLVASREWEITDDSLPSYAFTTKRSTTKSVTPTSVPTENDFAKSVTTNSVWLKSCHEDPCMEYLRLWPEGLYKLSIDCNKIEVPDISARQPVLLEGEYYRDPYERFGPPRLSTRTGSILPPLQMRAKIVQRKIPIYIPTIEDHLNAYLDQLREETDTGWESGAYPTWNIRCFIRFLFLDWAPTREWLMTFKIHERNQTLMTERLDKFRRKLLILYDPVLQRSVFDKMPWELSIRPEFQT